MTKKKQGATPKSKAKNIQRMDQTSLKQLGREIARHAANKGHERGQRLSTGVPVAFVDVTRNSKPRIRHLPNGDVEVSHTEFIGPILSDVKNQFAYDVYPIDLSNNVTFPWGSQMFDLFESGIVEELDVVIKSSLSTSTSGLFEVGIDYDAQDDTDSITEQQLMNWEDSVESNLWKSVMHRSKRANLRKALRERFQSDDDSDHRFSSFGNIIVATTPTNAVGSADASGNFPVIQLGHLYLRYKVIVKTPVLNSAASKANRAIAPQIDLVVNTAASGASAGTNLLTGLASTEAPVSSVQLDDTYNIEIFQPLVANSVLQENTNATYASTTTSLLRFKEDFNGVLTFVANQLDVSGTTSTPTVTQYMDTVALNFGSKVNDDRTPDLSKNVFNVIAHSLVPNGVGLHDGILTFTARVLAQAGTIWRIAGHTYSAASTMIKYLSASSNRRYGPKGGTGDLLMFGSNNIVRAQTAAPTIGKLGD